MAVESFAWVPNAVLRDDSLTGGARLLYAVLCGYADKSGECWPSHATLAKDMGLKVRQIRNQLRELERAGHIHWTTGWHGRSNFYTVLRKAPWTPT